MGAYYGSCMIENKINLNEDKIKLNKDKVNLNENIEILNKDIARLFENKINLNENKINLNKDKTNLNENKENKNNLNEDEENLIEDDYISIKNEFYNFRKQLSEKIKSPEITLSKKECCLIEKSSIDELEEGFKKYEIQEKENKKVKNFNYFKLMPEDFIFINDFVSIINYLKKGKKIKLVIKKIFENMYHEDILKGEKCVEYYSGKNLLLIKFQNEYESIILYDPLNEKEIQNRIFIVLMKNKKNNNKLLKNLLNEKNQFNNSSEEKYNDITIIPYKIYINIIKFFVYLYYYEKDLSIRKKEIFKENEDYYLIDNEWIDKFKKYYESLSIQIFKKDNIKYNDLENQFEEKITLSKEYKLEKELFKETLNIEGIKSGNKKIFNILYNTNCYIITSQMMNIIKSIFNNKEINCPKQKIITMNDNIYLIYPKKVIVGNLNQNFIFNTKYILAFSSVDKLESEKEKLFKNSIENYIKSNNCDLKNYELQKILRNNEMIAKLVVIKSDESTGNHLDSNNENIINNKEKEKEKINNKKKLENTKLKSGKKNNSSNKINDVKNEKNEKSKENPKGKEEEENMNEAKNSNKNENNNIEQLNVIKEELSEKNKIILNQENKNKKQEKKLSKNEDNLKNKEIELKNKLEKEELEQNKLQEKESKINILTKKIKKLSKDNNEKKGNSIEEKDKLVNNNKIELEESNKKENEEINKSKEKVNDLMEESI